METLIDSSAAPSSVAFWRSRTSRLVLLMVVVFAGALLRVADLDDVSTRTPDERYYTWQADTLLDQGSVQGYTTLFQSYDPDYPPPARIGYHLLLTAAMRLSGDRSVAVGGALACAASILALLVVAFGAWRLLSPEAAVAAALLYAANPASLMFARRAWQESLVELLSALCLVGAGLAFSRGVSWRSSAAWCLLGVACLSVKEITALVWVLVTAIGIVLRLVGPGRIEALRLSAAALLAAALTAGWWAALMGGLGTLSRLHIFAVGVTRHSDYGRAYETGTPWDLLHGLWIISFATLLLALLGTVSALWRLVRTDRSRAAWFCAGLATYVVFFLFTATFVSNKMNFRFISVIFVPLALLAAAGVEAALLAAQRFFPAADPQVFRLGAFVLVATLAGYDLSNFHRHFGPEMQDMSIRMVLQAGGQTFPAPPVSVPVASPPAQAQALTAAQWIDLSAQQARNGANRQSLASAQRAIALEPNNAIAWNNMAAAYENLQNWDLAIAAAQRALQLQPDFQLARNNLNWSLTRKRLHPAP